HTLCATLSRITGSVSAWVRSIRRELWHNWPVSNRRAKVHRGLPVDLDLRGFLEDLQERLPYDFVRIERTVAPHQFEVTALLQHLENQKKFPVLFFEKPL